MSVTLNSIDELADNFELLGDWESRFGYLIDLGKELPPMDAADQSEVNRVHGVDETAARSRWSHHHRGRQ